MGSVGSYKQQPRVTCQICDKPGRSAKQCYRGKQFFNSPPTVNYTSTSRNAEQGWLMDSAASHHVTPDLTNLSLHSDYELKEGWLVTTIHTGNFVLLVFFLLLGSFQRMLRMVCS